MPTVLHPSAIEPLLQIVRAEFHEMPCMRLTRAQFRRLWHLDDATTHELATLLIEEGFLCVDEHARLHRSDRDVG